MQPLGADEPTVVGPYRLLGRLGSGGMGRVYLGRSAGGRTVAVKIVHPHFALDEEFRARFRREVEAARRVGGAWTAPVLDADPDAAVPWVATAYAAGPSLAAAVTDGGPLPAHSVRALGAGLAEALAAVHELGLVHRDVKPSNVLLTLDGPLLIDFGIARATDGTASITSTGVSIGSPGYMSPEQILGKGVTGQADVFSLGAVLVHAATGEPPFRGDSSAALLYKVVHEEPELGAVGGELRELVASCLAKDPGTRPTPARVAARLAPEGAARLVAGGWLPGALVEQVSRSAVQLLNLEAAGTPETPPSGPVAFASPSVGEAAGAFGPPPLMPDTGPPRPPHPPATGPYVPEPRDAVPGQGQAAAPGPGRAAASGPNQAAAPGPHRTAVPGPHQAGPGPHPAVPGPHHAGSGQDRFAGFGKETPLGADTPFGANTAPGTGMAPGIGAAPGTGTAPGTAAASGGETRPGTGSRSGRGPGRLSVSVAADSVPGTDGRGRRMSCTVALAVAGALAAVTVGSVFVFDLLPGHGSDKDSAGSPPGRTYSSAPGATGAEPTTGDEPTVGSSDEPAPTTTASPSASGGPGAVPARYLGTWEGQGTGLGGTVPMGTFRVTVHQAATGAELGQVRNTDPLGTSVCVDVLTLEKVSGGRLVARAKGADSNPATCSQAASTVYLTPSGDGLTYRSDSTDSGEPEATLARTD
ncbi:serine/threonine-protein kinase [Streptomyces mangrovisoli]|uniref:Serine/threonine protein kinase n=1 Tax=Streptomyces mangrovisoli TaxID=1428628 RepID=A0A1J4NXM0_9ACTN|nr:serine/threonine-protein kinase [Streptomyces mangrovisoli]OIJ66786.1 serine/threonine protein kinase [Streptomyces mangrovisoli]